jgi:hypothetical protein
MDLAPVMRIDDRQRRVKFHLRYRNVAFLSGYTGKSTSWKAHPRDRGQASNISSRKETGDSEGSFSSITSSYSRRKLKK